MDFSKSIIINRLETMFHFQKISLPKGSRYHITTDEANGPVHSFDMEAPQGQWKIIDAPKVPEWIKSNEDKLIEILAIEEITR